MKHILIVEDEPDIQELLCAYLRNAGYQTAVAGDGVSAWSLFQKQAFDLILHKAKPYDLINIAGKSEVTIHQVAETVWRLMNKEGDVEEHIEYVRDREFNDFRYAIDGTKLEKMGWTASTTFEEGMKETGV